MYKERRYMGYKERFVDDCTVELSTGVRVSVKQAESMKQLFQRGAVDRDCFASATQDTAGDRDAGAHLVQERQMNTGLTVWDASVVLAHCFSDSRFRQRLCFPSPATECLCLELGAGCGLAGIALACSVTVDSLVLTDLPQVCLLTSSNVAYNRAQLRTPERRLHIEPLEWTDRPGLKALCKKYGRFPDLLFGADLIYWGPHSDQAKALVHAIDQLLGHGSIGLFALTRHNEESIQVFKELLLEKELVVDHLESEISDRLQSEENVLIRVRRPQHDKQWEVGRGQ